MLASFSMWCCNCFLAFGVVPFLLDLTLSSPSPKLASFGCRADVRCINEQRFWMSVVRIDFASRWRPTSRISFRLVIRRLIEPIGSMFDPRGAQQIGSAIQCIWLIGFCSPNACFLKTRFDWCDHKTRATWFAERRPTTRWNDRILLSIDWWKKI